MSDSPRVQYSRFYDKDQLVLRGTPEEVIADAKTLADNAAEVQKALEDFGQVLYANRSTSKASPPAGTTSEPASSGPECRHGDRVFKSGTSKAGKPYKMWSCPSSDRNDQCDPVWIK